MSPNNETTELTAEEQLEIGQQEFRDRVDEYIAGMTAFVYADPTAKQELADVIDRKLDEIKAVGQRLNELARSVPGATMASTADQNFQMAARMAGWTIPIDLTAYHAAVWCQRQALDVTDPVARMAVIDWVRRALRFVRADKRAAATKCLVNARSALILGQSKR
ncbi:MAG: hypothetical protein ACHREM_15770 [Polyangiales bacterium]